MAKRIHNYMKTHQGPEIAFLVLVVLVYLTFFVPGGRSYSLPQLLLLFALGIVYIIFGFTDVRLVSFLGRTIGLWFYFGVEIGLGLLIQYVAGFSGASWLLLIPLAASATILLSPIGVFVVCFALVVALAVSIYINTGSWTHVPENVLSYSAGLVFVVIFTRAAVNEAEARGKVEELAKELQEANRKLREYAAQAEELATTKERNRLAREIHDSLGHYFTVINMQLEASRAVLSSDREKALGAMEKAQQLTREGLAEVRRSVSALRASPTEGLTLPESIEKLLAECRTAGLLADLEVAGIYRSLAPQLELTLYRAAQEGLTNVRKHSRASMVKVSLDYGEKDKVRLLIQDNGLGSDKPEGGFGLLGIRERVQLLGGETRIITGSEEGFKLEVEIPE